MDTDEADKITNDFSDTMQDGSTETVSDELTLEELKSNEMDALVNDTAVKTEKEMQDCNESNDDVICDSDKTNANEITGSSSKNETTCSVVEAVSSAPNKMEGRQLPVIDNIIKNVTKNEDGLEVMKDCTHKSSETKLAPEDSENVLSLEMACDEIETENETTANSADEEDNQFGVESDLEDSTDRNQMEHGESIETAATSNLVWGDHVKQLDACERNVNENSLDKSLSRKSSEMLEFISSASKCVPRIIKRAKNIGFEKKQSKVQKRIEKISLLMVIPKHITQGSLQNYMMEAASKVKNLPVTHIPVWIFSNPKPIAQHDIDMGKEAGLIINHLEPNDKNTNSETVKRADDNASEQASFDITSVRSLQNAFLGQKTGIIIYTDTIQDIYVDEIVKESCTKGYVKEAVIKARRIQIPIIAVLASVPVNTRRLKELSAIPSNSNQTLKNNSRNILVPLNKAVLIPLIPVPTKVVQLTKSNDETLLVSPAVFHTPTSVSPSIPIVLEETSSKSLTSKHVHSAKSLSVKNSMSNHDRNEHSFASSTLKETEAQTMHNDYKRKVSHLSCKPICTIVDIQGNEDLNSVDGKQHTSLGAHIIHSESASQKELSDISRECSETNTVCIKDSNKANLNSDTNVKGEELRFRKGIIASGDNSIRSESSSSIEDIQKNCGNMNNGGTYLSNACSDETKASKKGTNKVVSVLSEKSENAASLSKKKSSADNRWSPCICCGRNFNLFYIFSRTLRGEGFPEILYMYGGFKITDIRGKAYICVVCRSQAVKIRNQTEAFLKKCQEYASKVGRNDSGNSEMANTSVDSASMLSEKTRKSDVTTAYAHTQTEPGITGCHCHRPLSNKITLFKEKERSGSNSSRMGLQGKEFGGNFSNKPVDKSQKPPGDSSINVYIKDKKTGLLYCDLVGDAESAIRTTFEKYCPKISETKIELKTSSQETGSSATSDIGYRTVGDKTAVMSNKGGKSDVLNTSIGSSTDIKVKEKSMSKTAGQNGNDTDNKTKTNIVVQQTENKFLTMSHGTETEDTTDNELKAGNNAELFDRTKSGVLVEPCTASQTEVRKQMETSASNGDKKNEEVKRRKAGEDSEDKNVSNSSKSFADHSYCFRPESELDKASLESIKRMLFSTTSLMFKTEKSDTCKIPSIVFSCCGNQVAADDICDHLLQTDFMRKKFEAKILQEVRFAAICLNQKDKTERSLLLNKNFEDVLNLNWGEIFCELCVKFPFLAKLLTTLTDLPSKRLGDAIPQLAVIYGMIMFIRDKRYSRIQHYMSNTLLENLAGRKLFEPLSHMGLCLTYNTTITYFHTNLTAGKQHPTFNLEKIREERKKLMGPHRSKFTVSKKESKDTEESYLRPVTEKEMEVKSQFRAAKRRRVKMGQGAASKPKQLKLEDGQAVPAYGTANSLLLHFGQQVLADQKQMMLTKFKPLMKLAKSPTKKRKKVSQLKDSGVETCLNNPSASFTVAKSQQKAEQIGKPPEKKICLIQKLEKDRKVVHVTEDEFHQLLSKRTETSVAVNELLRLENKKPVSSKSQVTPSVGSLSCDRKTITPKEGSCQAQIAANKIVSPGKALKRSLPLRKAHLLTPADLRRYQISYSIDYISRPPCDMLDNLESYTIPKELEDLYDDFTFDISNLDMKKVDIIDMIMSMLITTSKRYQDRVRAFPKQFPGSRYAHGWLKAVTRIMSSYKNGVEVGRKETMQFMQAFIAYSGLDRCSLKQRQMRVLESKLVSEPAFCYGVADSTGTLKTLIIVEIQIPVSADKTTEKSEAVRGLDGELFQKLAGELLLEVPHTFFYPYTFGLVFHKTSVMVARLHISREHLRKLQMNMPLSPAHQATIVYSRFYNLLNSNDRLEILRFLWKLRLGSENSDVGESQRRENQHID